jgi:hypothetical protein
MDEMNAIINLRELVDDYEEMGATREVVLTVGDLRALVAAVEALSTTAPDDPVERTPLQARVAPWMQECFGPVISADRLERSDRFLEEALELTQAADYTADRAHALVDYVFGRPRGELVQEVGGVMVTLAALCLAQAVDMHEAGERELARINAPATIAKIRAKQAAKARDIPFSPLPQTVPAPSAIPEAREP